MVMPLLLQLFEELKQQGVYIQKVTFSFGFTFYYKIVTSMRLKLLLFRFYPLNVLRSDQNNANPAAKKKNQLVQIPVRDLVANSFDAAIATDCIKQNPY